MTFSMVRQKEVEGILHSLSRQFPNLDFTEFDKKITMYANQQEEGTSEQLHHFMILTAIERITALEPDWTYVAASLYIKDLYEGISFSRGKSKENLSGSFYQVVKDLTVAHLYSPSLLDSYSKEEVDYLGSILDFSRDQLFTYIGIVTLAERYLTKSHNGKVLELPQERFMVISMTLCMNEEKEKRIPLIEEAYWALSNLYMTVATPTFANAGKSHGQLSSCFIDTVEDDLRSIYDSNTDVSTLSKNGGGLGIYLGKVRSRGSDIKGFKGVSSGVIPWMKQLNNTAVSVDQLGQRQGAIAVYLDVWHKDIFPFLDTRLNNGDERQRTHDLFTGVSLPDLFMEQVEKREDWYLFDPHEVKGVMGFSLEDFYDETSGAGSFREKYWECVAHPTLSREVVPAIEIFKRIMISQLETGTPYMFYRDSVNRMNANPHKGMIYCSNLCTEIAQNMSATVMEEEVIQDGKIVTYKSPGDYVVCNLASISLAKTILDDELERVVAIGVRLLDNVIDLNDLPVLQAQITNQRYRGIGLGTFGWHHLLALKGLKWESSQAVDYCDYLYEEIAYYTIKASHELAKEKGSYPYFDDSDWATGDYFLKRDYSSERWIELKDGIKDKGIRNGYLMAVAPNSSTSIIAGSSASIDPIFRLQYSEEKKDYKIPVTAPDLSPETTWYYKTAYQVDQHWSVEQNARRQRHIDQGISFNLYVRNDIKAKDLLDLHLDAWKSGLKTTYYVRSTSVSNFEECESCHS
ncbi:ribonucleoside-diphosphate reductase subunit alpha [Rossellomorea vietnamensis]|uniref:Ribonucleoside-diphosphate reductase subunit alpha n=1 Tax=Rossellomorea vietnamensis TaxID=218284 RepID=A0ACD4CAJ5_9BACI|nr:ribonucleoside-diphosphate reductase subunit alpha [Rossellomorea vietnamensis]UXH45675.1 ribonucleoside-diphosphate reductase subunit alpha [Rossellomorea vietnamensis]WQI97056.1 ribonucleoside-diphosphate reductase subunit alpha [Rossellomorea vietnamensis]